jgi:starch synthase
MVSEQQSITSVWMFTREYGALAGAGGIKDVAAQLSKTLARWNARKVHVVLPCYGFMQPRELGFERLPDPLFPERALEFDVPMNYTTRERKEQVKVWYKVQDKVRLYLLEAERYREKSAIYTYTREEFQRESWKTQGSGHFDFFAMNILLQKAGLDLIMLLGEKPQIIHCHDGHTAVTPALMRECSGYRHYFRNSAAVVTIHNAGVGYHQEVSDLPFVQAITSLPRQVVSDCCLEHSFDPFIAAGNYATVSTVSENYARELQETDNDYLTGWLGHRLLANGVKITGITNGIDPAEFNPQSPDEMGLSAGYDVRAETSELRGKTACKRALLETLSLAPDDAEENRIGYLAGDPDLPLYSFVGRLSEQKGVDILTEAIELFLAGGTPAQFVCLGSGGVREEAALSRIAEMKAFRGRICFLRGFNPDLARRIYAASDFFVIPSRYEPCGLTDYIAQLFGALPVVHHVGGLVKVIDGETGFADRDNSPENLMEAMNRSLQTFEDREVIRCMQKKAVERIHRFYTWDKVMKSYIRLYKQSRARLRGPA